MSEEVIDTPTAAPAPAAAPKTFDSVADGVAELERRANERRLARRADKAEREERVAEDRQKAAKTVADMESDLDAEDEAEDGEEAKPKRKPAAKDTRQAADDSDGEEDSEDDGDDVSAEDEDDADDSDEDDEDDDKSLKKPEKLKVGDTEVEIPKGTPKAAVEAIKSLQHRLTSDYTRKTQEVAQGRQAVAQRAEALETQSQQVLQAQEAVVRLAEQMVGQPPPLEMAQHDIQQYTIQKALYEQRVAQLQGLGGHAQQLKQAQAQRQQQEQQQRLAQEEQQMLRVMPALANPQARQQFLAQAVRAVQASGFSPEDVAAVGDHKMLHFIARFVHMESQLAAMQRAGGSVKTKLANVPPKTVRGGNASPDQGKGARDQKAQKEFMNSKRSLQDVKRYLESRGG